MKRIGVRFTWYNEQMPDFIKNDALYFDEILICGYPYPIEMEKMDISISAAVDAKFLKIIDTGFLRERYGLPDSVRRQIKVLSNILSYELGGNINDYGIDVLTRMGSIHLQVLDPSSLYIPIVKEYPEIEHKESRQAQIINLIIRQFPIISHSVRWEQILEFKQDPDSKFNFIELRNWLTDIAKSDLRLNEIEEKTEYLMEKYRKHVELYRLKFEKGSLEIVIISVLEAVENLARLKFSKIAKSLFTIREKQTALLEAELNAPGRELAYIYKAKSFFA